MFERIDLRFGIGQSLYRLAVGNFLPKQVIEFLGGCRDLIKLMDLPHDRFTYALETQTYPLWRLQHFCRLWLCGCAHRERTLMMG